MNIYKSTDTIKLRCYINGGSSDNQKRTCTMSELYNYGITNNLGNAMMFTTYNGGTYGSTVTYFTITGSEVRLANESYISISSQSDRWSKGIFNINLQSSIPAYCYMANTVSGDLNLVQKKQMSLSYQDGQDNNRYYYYTDLISEPGFYIPSGYDIYVDGVKQKDYPSSNIIFPMAGPLAHSGQDYSFPLNMYTFTYIRGYVDIWHCIELDGVDNFKTTIISGDWSSIDAKYGQLNGATVVVSRFGTNMISKLRQVLSGDIDRYTLFNETNLHIYFTRQYNSSKGIYNLRVNYITPYTEGEELWSGWSTWTLDYLSNYDGIYAVYYFNCHPTTANPGEYLQVLFVQNGSYSGMGNIGYWPTFSGTKLANEKYYRTYMVESIPECSMKII